MTEIKYPIYLIFYNISTSKFYTNYSNQPAIFHVTSEEHKFYLIKIIAKIVNATFSEIDFIEYKNCD